MDFDWTTFALEVINFLILLWLLKRFLYAPVLAIIERRREAVRRTLADAEAAREQARRLQAESAALGQRWEGEREQRLAQLQQQLDAEAARRRAALAAELDAERARRTALDERERDTHERALQAQAAAQATRFAAVLLQRLDMPALDQRLRQMLDEDLAAMPAATRETLRRALATAPQLEVTSATELDATARAGLEQSLRGWLQPLPPLRYRTDPALGRGLRLQAGAWELDASLAGQLDAFRGSADDV